MSIDEKILLKYSIVTILLILFIGCSNNLPDNKKIILSPTKAISMMSDSSFYQDIGDIILYEDNFYLFDNSPSIFVLDKDLRLLSRINNIGRGPGEFTGISDLEVFEDNIYILNFQDQKIVVFNNKGEFINSIVPEIFSADIAVANKEEIFISNPNARNPLIKINANGNVVKKFGEKITEKAKKNVIRDEYFLTIFKDKLLALNKAYPLLNIYNLDGELINSHRFTNPIIQDRFQQIKLKWTDNNYPERAIILFILFNDIAITKNRIFITLESNKDTSLPDYAFAYDLSENNKLIFKEYYEIPSINSDQAMNATSFTPMNEMAYLLFDLHTSQLMIYE